MLFLNSSRIFGSDADEAFRRMCNYLLVNGEICSPRGMEIREVLGANITIENPYENVVVSKARNISRKYLSKEFIWYCSGNRTKEGSDYICKAAPFWNTIRNKDGSLNSNYGYYWFTPIDLQRLRTARPLYVPESFFDISQNIELDKQYNFAYSPFTYCLWQLLNDNDTRQAVININSIEHKLPLKDTPCTVYIQFFIRKNELHMFVNMRSCDLVLGFCNDVFQFTMLQSLMLNELRNHGLNLNMGTFSLFAGSLHVYEQHFDMISSCADLYYNNYSEEVLYDDTLDKLEICKAHDISFEDVKTLANIVNKNIIPEVKECTKDVHYLIKEAYPDEYNN